jgi:hypothetical protein
MKVELLSTWSSHQICFGPEIKVSLLDFTAGGSKPTDLHKLTGWRGPPHSGISVLALVGSS